MSWSGHSSPRPEEAFGLGKGISTSADVQRVWLVFPIIHSYKIKSRGSWSWLLEGMTDSQSKTQTREIGMVLHWSLWHGVWERGTLNKKGKRKRNIAKKKWEMSFCHHTKVLYNSGGKSDLTLCTLDWIAETCLPFCVEFAQSKSMHRSVWLVQEKSDTIKEASNHLHQAFNWWPWLDKTIYTNKINLYLFEIP